MSEIERAFSVTYTPEEARLATDEVKKDVTMLGLKLLSLYEGGAWKALDYSSWGTYCQTEFAINPKMAYYTVQSGRVMRILESAEVKPANIMQAGELAPLIKRPDELRKVWDEVVEENPSAVSLTVREKVKVITSNGKKEPAKVVQEPEEETTIYEKEGVSPAQNIFQAAFSTGLAYAVLDELQYLPEDEVEEVLAQAWIAQKQWTLIVESLRSLKEKNGTPEEGLLPD